MCDGCGESLEIVLGVESVLDVCWFWESILDVCCVLERVWKSCWVWRESLEIVLGVERLGCTIGGKVYLCFCLSGNSSEFIAAI